MVASIGKIASPSQGVGYCRVEDWRASFKVRWLFRRFRSGPQSGSLGRVSSPTGSPEAVTHLRLPQNAACGFPARRSSETDSQHRASLKLRIGQPQLRARQRIPLLDPLECLPCDVGGSAAATTALANKNPASLSYDSTPAAIYCQEGKRPGIKRATPETEGRQGTWTRQAEAEEPSASVAHARL